MAYYDYFDGERQCRRVIISGLFRVFHECFAGVNVGPQGYAMGM